MLLTTTEEHKTYNANKQRQSFDPAGQKQPRITKQANRICASMHQSSDFAQFGLHCKAQFVSIPGLGPWFNYDIINRTPPVAKILFGFNGDLSRLWCVWLSLFSLLQRWFQCWSRGATLSLQLQKRRCQSWSRRMGSQTQHVLSSWGQEDN